MHPAVYAPIAAAALAWLWTHWGTTEMLRHVAEDESAAAAQHLAIHRQLSQGTDFLLGEPLANNVGYGH